MDYYDALGVPRDASADDIKKAFRKAAKKHHPDREGGDADAMARVNQAYQVLSTPESRKHYDETGADQPADSPELQAEMMAMQALQHVMGKGGNVINAAKRWLGEQRASARQQRQMAEHEVKMLTERKKHIKCSGPKNLAHRIIDSQVGQMRHVIEQLVQRDATIDAAMKILSEHTDDVKDPEFKRGSAAAFFAATGAPTMFRY